MNSCNYLLIYVTTGYCPKGMDSDPGSNMHWSDTRADSDSIMPCPQGATGDQTKQQKFLINNPTLNRTPQINYLYRQCWMPVC